MVLSKEQKLFELPIEEEELKSPVHKRPKHSDTPRVAHMFLRDVKTGETKLTPKGPVIGQTLVQML